MLLQPGNRETVACMHTTPCIPLLHPCNGVIGAQPSARGLLQVLWPCPNTFCSEAEPSTTRGPSISHGLKKDEDGDRQGDMLPPTAGCPVTAAHCWHYKTTPVPGRCCFSANSCVKESDGYISVLWSKGGFPWLFLTLRQ